MLKVLVVDDEPLIRAGLKKFVEQMEGFTWCGEARNGRQALALT